MVFRSIHRIIYAPTPTTLAAVLLASTVEEINSDTSHVAGSSHTDNNSGYNIDTETPTHRYAHNLNSRKNKSPVWSGLGGNDGPSASVAQTEYWGPLHSQAE